ncbi:MAG: malectin domain-containing carbohydrate-binding protein [Terriglobia bacterium]
MAVKMGKQAHKAENYLLSRKRHLIARRNFILSSVVGVAQAYAAVKSPVEMTIAHPRDASPLEVLAAREICRYLYLRTGKLLPILPSMDLPHGFRGFVIGQKRGPLLTSLLGGSVLRKTVGDLQAQQFLLKRIASEGREFVLVAGGDPIGTLYGAYQLAEDYDVRFCLHGDVVPDRQISLNLANVNAMRSPLFELRGVNPWGSHAEGCDLWNVDDYKAIISQLAKMRMNFIGIHGYPEARRENASYGAEPTVWIGLPSDSDKQGNVTFSYSSSYFNTLRRGWFGYREAKKTSEFSYGASLLFERDDWGSDVMVGHCPQPVTSGGYNEVFNRTGMMLRSAFLVARFLNIKTCLGTEMPLIIPKKIREKLQSQGRDPSDPCVVEEVYEGMFARLAKAHPLDYYWFWTPEDWTWQGVSDETVKNTVNDIDLGIRAAKAVGQPFQLATAGWVLGPPQDRTLFGRVLPKAIAVSEIARMTGKWPIDPGFARISGRPKWAIPWLEDDPALTSPQLWVGRVRKDASDALAYSCTGLMGLHWRTRILGPNISALAHAAWDQSAWAPPAHQLREAKEGPVGGRKRSVATPESANTPEGALYQTFRFEMESYRLKIPNGIYRVTLKFLESDYSKPGERVFDVKIQNLLRIAKLDLVAVAARRLPHDEVVDHVDVSDGWLVIEFVPHASLPVISAIVVQNENYSRKINCGGAAYQDYSADWPDASETPDRFLSSADFYDDWARIEFGAEVAARAAAIFRSIDCHLPVTSSWVVGAGDVAPDNRPWQEVVGEFGFVDSLERLRPEVRDPGNVERFEFWLNTFRYMRVQAHVRCLLAEFNLAMKRAQGEQNQNARARLARHDALPVYQRLLNAVGEACRFLLSTVSTKGCLGTIINWQQKIWPVLVEKTGQELSAALGSTLPLNVQPPKEYQGEPRIIVPTLESILEAGEELPVKVIFIDRQPPRGLTLYYRLMGRGEFRPLALTHVARGVYRATLPAHEPDVVAMEYYLRADTRAGQIVFFPATAPTINQTVVIVGRPDKVVG